MNLIGVPGALPLEAMQRLGVARVSYGPWSQNVALTALADLAAAVRAGGGIPENTRQAQLRPRFPDVECSDGRPSSHLAPTLQGL